MSVQPITARTLRDCVFKAALDGEHLHDLIMVVKEAYADGLVELDAG